MQSIDGDSQTATCRQTGRVSAKVANSDETKSSLGRVGELRKGGREVEAQNDHLLALKTGCQNPRAQIKEGKNPAAGLNRGGWGKRLRRGKC